MPEWIVALISVVLGAGIIEFRHWRDSREQFRVMTFEKRLQTHQEALSYCYKLYHSIFSRKDEGEKNKTVNEVGKWWEDNCLLLDEKSRRKMLDLVGDARDYVNGFAESQSTVQRTFRETLRVISQGIGVKHLPENPNLKKEEKTFQG